MASLDSFNCRREMDIDGTTYTYFDLTEAEKNGLNGASKLPYTLKVLLENLLRFEDGKTVTKADIEAIAKWTETGKSTHEIAYRPARVLMQDFTGVPAVVDLAAMRDGLKALGGDPARINPVVPADLVIDHSVQVDFFGTDYAFTNSFGLLTTQEANNTEAVLAVNYKKVIRTRSDDQKSGRAE